MVSEVGFDLLAVWIELLDIVNCAPSDFFFILIPNYICNLFRNIQQKV
jgi:hypothetical protein